MGKYILLQLGCSKIRKWFIFYTIIKIFFYLTGTQYFFHTFFIFIGVRWQIKFRSKMWTVIFNGHDHYYPSKSPRLITTQYKIYYK